MEFQPPDWPALDSFIARQLKKDCKYVGNGELLGIGRKTLVRGK
jgi:hypothetical protein